MTDSRFKFTVKAAAVVIIAVAGLYFFSPSKDRSERAERDAGEYIYRDGYGIVHTRRTCNRLNYKGMTHKRIRTADFRPNGNDQFCSKCVSDRQYERLSLLPQSTESNSRNTTYGNRHARSFLYEDVPPASRGPRLKP